MEKHVFSYRVVLHIRQKDQCFFLVFDIEIFYPSISTKPFGKAILFAKLYYDFTSDELEIIMHPRKTLLLWQDSTWVNKRAMKILTYQWDVMMAQKYGNW